MKRQDIIDQVVRKTELTSREATQAVEAVIAVFEESIVKGESIYLRGFATFKQVVKKEKKGQNIKGGYTVTIPARRSVKLILSKELKDKMNDGNADD